MPRGSENVDLDEVLYEIQQVGNVIRVAAIDPKSNTEVVIVGSPAMSLYSLKVNAVKKLMYVLEKKKAEKDTKR